MRRLVLFLTATLWFMAVGAVGPVNAQATAADVIASDPDLATLQQALQLADPAILQALNEPGGYTVLAPNNEAFERLSRFLDVPLAAILADTDLLSDLLRYHVVDGALFTTQMSEVPGQVLPTLLEGSFVIVDEREDGTLAFNSAGDVLRADIGASNGLIHVIDDVLLNRIINAAIADIDLDATPQSPDDGTTETAEDPVLGPTMVRFAHLSPDAPPVDIYINDAMVAPNATFGAFTDFVLQTSGNVSVSVVPAGQPPESAVLDKVPLELDGDYFTVSVVGSAANETLALVPVTQTFTDLPEGSARVQVFNALADPFSLVSFDSPLTQLQPQGTITLDLDSEAFDGPLQLIVGDAEPSYEFNAETLTPGYFYFISLTGDDRQVQIDEQGPATVESVRSVLRDALAAGEPVGSIIDVLRNREDANQFIETLTSSNTDLLNQLSDADSARQFTVFVPTDQAFDNLLASLNTTPANFLSTPRLVAQIMLYHVVPENLTAAEIAGQSGEGLQTLLPSNFILIFMTENGTLQLNEIISVEEADIQADNGIIHIVDNVLLPVVALRELGIRN